MRKPSAAVAADRGRVREHDGVADELHDSATCLRDVPVGELLEVRDQVRKILGFHLVRQGAVPDEVRESDDLVGLVALEAPPNCFSKMAAPRVRKESLERAVEEALRDRAADSRRSARSARPWRQRLAPAGRVSRFSACA